MNRRTLASTLFSLGLAVVAAFSMGSAQAFTEGKEFKTLAKPQPTDSGNKIEVIEFFSYGCPHCRDLEPHLAAWLAKLPPDVQFKRVPVVFNPSWEGLSKIYFTLDNLGVADKYALDVFSAVHTDNKKMQDPKVFLEWAEKKGLERKKVEDIYQSFSINSKLTRARSLVENHKIESVPSIVVNGKYLTGPHMLPGGHASIGDALNTLLEKARKDKK